MARARRGRTFGPKMRMLAVLLLAVGAFAAPGAAAAVDIPAWSGLGPPDAEPWQAGPVITADGSIVVGVRRSDLAFDIDRIAPGATSAQRLATLALPQRSVEVPMVAHYWATELALVPAGRGFFLIQGDKDHINHAGLNGYVQSSRLTWFADPAGPGVEVAGVGGDYGASSCADLPVVSGAPGRDRALIVAPCENLAVVRPLDGGAETPVALPGPIAPQLAGDYVSGLRYGPSSSPGGIVNWRTGETVRTWSDIGTHLLLDDGTVLYTDGRTNVLLRLGPTDAAPTALDIVGSVVAMAGERLVTRSAYGAEPRATVWTLGGRYVTDLPGVSWPVAFDGTRIVYAERSCITTRVQSWAIRSGFPMPLEAACGRPAVLWPVDVRPSGAKALLTCPSTTAQGCMGEVALARPGLDRPYVRTFVLRPGRQQWYRLTPRLGRARCERLARTRRWQVELSPKGGLTAFVPAQRRGHCQPGG